MKHLLLTAFIPLLTVAASAQESFQTPARIASPDTGSKVVWLLASTKTSFRYKTTEISTTFVDGKIKDFTPIYILETKPLAEAYDLFNGRDYKGAMKAFEAIKKRHEPIKTLKGNFYTLSTYYQLECMRKLGDYAGLKGAMADLDKDLLNRDDEVRQLELYAIWEAVQAENWDGVLAMTEERSGKSLPGYQLAQVAFCKGLALDKTGKKDEALIEYGIAMSADSGASEVITQQAALNTLRIQTEDKDVQAAISLWGKDKQNKASVGYTNLLKAGKLAALYELSLGNGVPLPADLKKLPTYKE